MRRIVVLRHGILINRFFMLPMERFFRGRGYEVHNRSYPSTRKLVEEHAQDLSDELLELDRQAGGSNYELSCVTHSLGGLVLRYALEHFPMPKLHAAVLLVPPNQGAFLARYFWKFPPFRWVFGARSGGQLAGHPSGMFEACGVPSGFPVGILAGDVRLQWHPAPLEKPNDRIVAVAEAALPPLPLKTVPFGHTPILARRRAWEEAAFFLENGYFRYP
jgi:triacylglycerol lipase